MGKHKGTKKDYAIKIITRTVSESLRVSFSILHTWKIEHQWIIPASRYVCVWKAAFANLSVKVFNSGERGSYGELVAMSSRFFIYKLAHFRLRKDPTGT